MSNTAITLNDPDSNITSINNTDLSNTGDNDTGANDSGASTQIRKSKLVETRKKLFTILLIGETGSGKTSFMSLLVNLFQGMGPLELDDKHDQSKESGLDRQFSQTTKATLYTVTSDGTKIRILDTPGLADTRGIDQDNKHKAEINKAIKEFITSIDAVIIMANGTVEKFGAATDYTLNVLTSMFPGSIIDNIGFIFTNSDVLTFNFKVNALQPELRKAKYWLIQNPLALYRGYKLQEEQDVPEEILEVHRNRLKVNYNETVETLNRFMKWLDERKVQPVKEINDLYQMSTSIEANIESVLSAITRLTDRREELKRFEFELGNAEKSKAALEELKKQEEAPVWVRIESDKVHTTCIAGNCYVNCHSPCTLNYMDKPADLGRLCWAFPSGTTPPGGDAARKCQQCGHEASMHRHNYYKHEQQPRKMESETKDKLEKAKTEEERLRIAKDFVQNQLTGIGEEINIAQEKIRRLVDDYNKIALSKNFAGHIRSAIAMLEFRKKELQSKPNTESELKLINDSIATFQKKLELLDKEKDSKRGIVNTTVSMAKGVMRSFIGDST